MTSVLTPPTAAPPTEAPVSRMLAALPRALEARGVEHAFLRGIAQTAAGRGGDVDLLVPPDALVRAARAVEEHAREHGLCLRARVRRAHVVHLHLYGVDGDGRHAFVSIDLHDAEALLGVPYLEASTLLARGRREGGARLLDPLDSALVDFLGPYLRGRVRPDYLARLAEFSGEELRERVAPLLGDAHARELTTAVRARDARTLEQRSRPLRRRLLARRFLLAPLRATSGFASCVLADRVLPWVRPRGMFVAFLGTDGAGKSTVIEAVLARLSGVYRAAGTGVVHLRPGLLPQLDRVVHLGRRTQGPEDWSRPHRARPSGRIVSNLRVAWYGLDYLVGYAARILPRRRRDALVVFDRYFYDYLVDPGRCRVRHGTLAARVLAGLVPRPDAVIVVSAPPDLVQRRKQELAPEESARQVAAYERLAESAPWIHVVRNETDVESAVQRTLHALFPVPPRLQTERRAA